MSTNTISWNNLCADILANPDVKAAYEALEKEFNIASTLIALRATTGLTQREFAEKVEMKQSQLARMESGQRIPKLETLAKFAAGAGYGVEVHFIPPQGKHNQKIQPLRVSQPNVVKFSRKID